MTRLRTMLAATSLLGFTGLMITHPAKAPTTNYFVEATYTLTYGPSLTRKGCQEIASAVLIDMQHSVSVRGLDGVPATRCERVQ